MKNIFPVVFVFSIFLFFSPLTQGEKVYQDYPFENADNNVRFNELLSNLRCLVCQNQSLADSDAVLAKDLRQKVYELINDNYSNDEIVQYLMLRYGDFILLKPQFKAETYLLWIGPAAILLLCAVFALRILYRIHARHQAKIL